MAVATSSPLAICARCGALATGFASIGDKRYCHGDDDPTPTCYMQAQVTNLEVWDPKTDVIAGAETPGPRPWR